MNAMMDEIPLSKKRRPSATLQALRAAHPSLLPDAPLFRLSPKSRAIEGLDGYTISIANTLEQRQKAWRVAYQVYLEKKYSEPNPDGFWYGIHDALPETLAFVAESKGRAAATLSVIPDSPLGLPAETAFADEVADLRARGRRICELSSLTCTEPNKRIGGELVRHLFKLAWLWSASHSDTLIIIVNPRHESFYRKVLLFSRFGPERSFEKVNHAAGVPLCLDLETAPERYRQKYQQQANGKNLFKFFVNGQESRLLAWVNAMHQPSHADEIYRFLAMRKARLPKAKPRDWTYLQFRHALASSIPSLVDAL